MKNFLIIISAILIFGSCEKIIDIDIDEKEKRIVANGIVSPDSLIKIQVSKSISILEDERHLQYLSASTVKLYADGEYVEKMNYTKNGYFVSTDTAVTGKKYSFDISYSDMTPVQGETQIPDLVEITKLDTSFVSNYMDGYYDSYYEFTIDFKDPAETQNYYFLAISYYEIIYDEYMNPYDSVQYFTYLENDDNLFGSYYSTFNLNGIEGQAFTDERFNGNLYSVKTRFYGYYYYDGSGSSPGHTYKVYLLSLSRDLYLHIASYIKSQEVGGDPFSQPVQVFSNITNGLGLFSAYNISTKTVYVKK